MKDIVPYSEALVLAILGFNEECFGLFVKDKSLLIKQMPNQQECEKYFGGILAPTFSQAFRFFREKYGLDSAVLENRYVIETKEDLPNWYYGFKTYEEAELACLQKLIQIVKDEKHTHIT